MGIKHPQVTIHVKGYDEPMILELFEDKAPKTVRNFMLLATSGYYQGAIFHRIIKNFMIQGGAGKGDARSIVGEFAENGFPGNDILHERGVISMARTSVPDSASSQFFIMHKTSAHLDGKYAAFGQMVSGYGTLDQIASVATGRNDKPVTDVIIESVDVTDFNG
jgi:peptidyl-prolyl cis-trans isomerase B (cyclophilin B)